MQALSHQPLIACMTVAVEPGAGDPGRLRAVASAVCRCAACSCSSSFCRRRFPTVAVLRQHRPHFLRLRSDRNDLGRDAGACDSGPGVRGVDRLRRVRRDRRRAGRGGAQSRRDAVRAFLTVSLPLAAPGLMASAIFVFLISLDEFSGTFFVGVPDVTHAAADHAQRRLEGNYQIASITALLLLVPSISLHALRRTLPQGRRAGERGALTGCPRPLQRRGLDGRNQGPSCAPTASSLSTSSGTTASASSCVAASTTGDATPAS